MNRLAGLETEYGCLTDDPLGSAGITRRVRDWLFADNRFGMVDQHQRDWDEPAGNGGFLFNGGRAYIDMGHLELCTPECLSLTDLLAHDQANDALLGLALADLRLTERGGFIRNNIDHYTGATFGCHENYLVRRGAPLNETNVQALLTFLTLRILYTGAGRIGSVAQLDTRTTGDPDASAVPFQISQRADYIQNDLFEWVQFNRAIINTRDEPLADARRFRRLHLLHGDANVLTTSLALKIGTTALILDLLEIDRLPQLILADAVGAMRAMSRRPDGAWRVALSDGSTADAVELLGQFHAAARAEFAGRDAETDTLLREWSEVLQALANDPEALVGRCDWVTKRWLFTQFIRSENLTWESPWLRSLDLEFHHTDPTRNLARPLARTCPDWDLSPEILQAAQSEAPPNTRAWLRSYIMQELRRRGRSCFVDWEVVDAEGATPLLLLDPFATDPTEAQRWLRQFDVPA